MISRRALLVACATGTVAAPLAALAQRPPRVAHLGFLSPASASAPGSRSRVEALRAGLRELGYVEGQNLAIEFRWAENQYERLADLAANLVGQKVDVLVTYGTPGTMAAKRATTRTPIVMATAGDAVLTGLVASIARPGGNITGLTFFNPELAAKRLELLKETLPRMRRAAVLLNPGNPAMKPVLAEMEPTARALKLELQQVGVRSTADFADAFAGMTARRVEAVVIVEDAMLNAHIDTLAELAARHRLPTIGLLELAEAGGLMAYAVDHMQMFRRAAYFVDRILKGVKPGDIPIERATKFEMILNLKAARALGITVPQAVLVRAEKLIE